MSIKILIDENIPLGEEFFSHLGEVRRMPGRTMRSEDMQGIDVLIVRSVTQVNEALLAGSSVKSVGTCTIGTDHLDIDYLNTKGIHWSSAPGCNANSVVEYVYAALCLLNCNWLQKKVGIIGCGNVGGLLYRRLKAQGVDVLCYDPHLSLTQNPDLTSLENVLSCDIVSMHTPLVKHGPYPSFHLIAERELRQLKQNAVLINCGRGAVIDNDALLHVLRERTDLQVVLDVWESEPQISLDLLDKVEIATPHIAGYSYDGRLNGTSMIFSALCEHLQIKPQVTLAELVPPLVDNQLTIERWQLKNDDSFALAQLLIQKAYDLAADDARLRDLARLARTTGISFGEGFDLQRKYYPMRREFHNYTLDLPIVKSSDEEWLASLGFN
jgi:erythronate-4-phosphate dehydrogenase